MHDESLGNFTPRAQQALALARREAERFNHNFLGTEHLLLGLTKLDRGEAVKVLRRMGLVLGNVRSEVEKLMEASATEIAEGRFPLTPRMVNVLSIASREAATLNHIPVGTDDILLGILMDGDGLAAKVLKNLGVSSEKIRQEITVGSNPMRGEEASEDVPVVEPISRVGGFDEARIRQLGDQFVAGIVSALDKSNTVSLPQNQRDWVYLLLDLLVVTGFKFDALEPTGVASMVLNDATIEELDILCRMIRSCDCDGPAILQSCLNKSATGSDEEFQVGIMLQMLTGQPPQRFCPPVDYLTRVRVGEPVKVVPQADDSAVQVFPDEELDTDSSPLVTGGASITEPPPDDQQH